MYKEKINHFFRQEYAKLVSIHTSYFGVGNLELIEDAVQDALFEATERWRFSGIPGKPEAWLYRVSKNKCLDKLKHLKIRREKTAEVYSIYETYHTEEHTDYIFEDELLMMIFTCAHPVLKQEDQIALTLKILCGFNTKEIAKAFLSNKKTIEQRIVRAKRKLREENVHFEYPTETEIKDRLNLVLKTIYLLFNEGYHSNSGEKQIRMDLCNDALRLTLLLTNFSLSSRPESFALQALLCFQMSRFEARLDEHGDILLLEEQDRSKWDQSFISAGLQALKKSSSGDVITEYHLQAGIAACHAISESDEKTNWREIVRQYQMLIEMNPNPVYKLNSAVAKYMNNDRVLAIEELHRLKNELGNYYLYPAVMAEIYLRENQKKDAKYYFNQALLLAENKAFKRYLLKKKSKC